MREDVEICRRNGWDVGTILEGSPTDCEDGVVIKITAIGETCVLAHRLAKDGYWCGESNWCLTYRQWRRMIGGDS